MPAIPHTKPSATQKCHDLSRHTSDSCGAELWIDGKCQDLPACALRDGQGALRVSEVCEALLQMQWNGIVDLGTDTGLREVRPQAITSRRSNHVLVPHVSRLHGDREAQRILRQRRFLEEPRV